MGFSPQLMQTILSGQPANTSRDRVIGPGFFHLQADCHPERSRDSRSELRHSRRTPFSLGAITAWRGTRSSDPITEECNIGYRSRAMMRRKNVRGRRLGMDAQGPSTAERVRFSRTRSFAQDDKSCGAFAKGGACDLFQIESRKHGLTSIPHECRSKRCSFFSRAGSFSAIRPVLRVWGPRC